LTKINYHQYDIIIMFN